MKEQDELARLLAPLTEPVDALASRRLHVERDRVVARMVEVSLQPPRRWWAAPRVAGAVALAAGIALAVWSGAAWWEGEGRTAQVLVTSGSVRAQGQDVSAGQRLSAGGTLEAPSAARLEAPGGVSLELAAHTRAELGSAALRLERGRVRCVVVHDPSRAFTVVTKDARVVDVGTTFSVSTEPLGTTVHVEEGEVRVEHARGAETVRAGQSWSSVVSPAPPIVAAAPSSAPPLTSVSPPARRAPVKPRADTLPLETQLLRTGLAAEQRGDVEAAARAFESLVQRYPGSPLAPDASAALARVRARAQGRR